MNKNIFREYDIRGKYPEEINEDVYSIIGKAIAVKCQNEKVNNVCLGRDGRLSGKILMEALEKSLITAGINVENIGLTTSPLLYYAAKKQHSKSGIMVTGSHNPKNYNGIKMVINDMPVSGVEVLSLVKKEIHSKNQGSITINNSIVDQYIEEVVDSKKFDLSSLKIVVDCGNGAAGIIAPKLFNALGCNVIEMFSEVDGNFPNHHPDPGNPNNLIDIAKMVVSEKADLGMAFDGDGDRLGLIDENGKLIFPDKIMMLFARDLLKSYEGGKVIFDVKCSSKLTEVIEENGGEAIMTPTGHFHIKNSLKETMAMLAGEMSGHIFFNDYWYGFDDAHYAGFRLLEIIKKNNRPLSKLMEEFPTTCATPEINIDVEDVKKFDVVNEFIQKCDFPGSKINTIDGIRIEYDDGWALLRASNTSPKLVFRFEGDNIESLKNIISQFKNQFELIFPNLEKIKYEE